MWCFLYNIVSAVRVNLGLTGHKALPIRDVLPNTPSIVRVWPSMIVRDSRRSTLDQLLTHWGSKGFCLLILCVLCFSLFIVSVSFYVLSVLLTL